VVFDRLGQQPSIERQQRNACPNIALERFGHQRFDPTPLLADPSRLAVFADGDFFLEFGRKIAGFQLTQDKLVDALQAITQGQLLAYQLGKLKDSGRLRPAQVSLGKRANVAMALEVARNMRSVLGANGISLEHPIFRHMVNLESVYTYEGTHEIHTLVVGADVTGVSAYA